MKSSLTYLLILIITFINPNAFAGEITGKISRLLSRSDGLHWVYISGSVSGKPACSLYSAFAIKDENSTYGKTQISQLMTAYASGQEIKIYGDNVCTRYSTAEDILTVELFNQ